MAQSKAGTSFGQTLAITSEAAAVTAAIDIDIFSNKSNKENGRQAEYYYN